ncbi:hypothetical protein D0Y65_035455 [Glycine soja]|uniref:Uncharacterized protein n=1 Tax=Glycine soja TaxID=3848 RepID=A0A445HAG4_GLYSO|nr:hypothetical protein D0Y65_035455 [Glycine soja]
MRRQRQPSRRAPKTLFRAHQPDSDESISDDDVFPNNAPSLHPTNKQELPLLVRLDILKGISNQNLNGKGNTSSFEKPLEDEVEMPDFNEGEVVANSTDEENNSADGLQKYGPRSIRNEQVRNRNRISEVLLHSKESASASHATYSKANTSGIKKAKPRFSLASVLCKSGGIDHSISNIESFPEIIKAVDPRASANLDGNHLDDDDRIEINSDIEPAETEALPHGFNMAPIANLFDNLRDKAHQETVIDSEDSPESVDSESSSDKEVSDQHMKITFPGKKMQTIAERFEEALGTSSVITEGTHVGAPNSLRPGIFGKLQHMILKEKETDMEFWKKLQPEARPDGKTFAFTLSAVSILIQVKHHLRLLSFLKQSLGSFSFILFLGQRGVCIK